MNKSKLSKFDRQIYEWCLAHPESPTSAYCIQMMEEHARRKHDPNLHLVAKAFVLMGERAK